MNELFEIFVVIFGSLGGAGVLILGLSTWLGKVWANRLMAKEKAQHAEELESIKSNYTSQLELLKNQLTQDTESYKIKLKKSEFIFEKEYDAASEFIAFKRGLYPLYHFPEMDMGNVLQSIAQDFEKIETFLRSYIAKYGAILSEKIKTDLSEAAGIAGREKFENEIDTTAQVNAQDVYGILSSVEDELIKKLISQTST
jgi:hypothetical protein